MRHIGDTPGGATPDERLQALEAQVRTLAEALRALASGLEEIPSQESERERAARGARLAHELLLSEGL